MEAQEEFVDYKTNYHQFNHFKVGGCAQATAGQATDALRCLLGICRSCPALKAAPSHLWCSLFVTRPTAS